MSRRTIRVNELLRREVSQVIQKDYEWHGSLVTVGAVEVTPDLKEAKVHVGVIGGKEAAVLARLNKEHGSIQSRVMQRVVLRNTPVMRFVADHSAERGVEIVNLLDEVAKLPTAPPEEEGEE